jgi:8-oxo-dGTP diphosphatase
MPLDADCPELLFIVAVALLDQDGCVLVQKRSPGRAMAGLWEFPGGKVEQNELPEAALVRELTEELGIVVRPEDLRPAGFASEPLDDRHLLLLLYLCRSWEGAPQPLEAAGLQWLLPNALRELDMPPADKPLIAQLERIV